MWYGEKGGAGKDVCLFVFVCVWWEGLLALSTSGRILNHIRYKHLLAKRSPEQLCASNSCWANIPPTPQRRHWCPNNQPAPCCPLFPAALGGAWSCWCLVLALQADWQTDRRCCQASECCLLCLYSIPSTLCSFLPLQLQFIWFSSITLMCYSPHWVLLHLLTMYRQEKPQEWASFQTLACQLKTSISRYLGEVCFWTCHAE